MSEEFTELMGEAMDECAPMRLIRKRDKMRKSIKKSPSEKKILHKRYKKLKNRVTTLEETKFSTMARESLRQNGNKSKGGQVMDIEGRRGKNNR